MSSMSQDETVPSAGPSVHVRVLSVPKQGASRDEYEDAAAVRDATWPVRAAVADGATESAFAKAWAETLVEGLSDTRATPEALDAGLPDWQAAWAEVHADRGETLPWYGAAKAREGAFATLLGLSLRHDGSWRAVAVGDGVLFHLRNNTLRQAWPYAAPDAFTNRPALLPSRSTQPAPAPTDYRAESGTWQAGDAFLLATDAVAAWLLRAEQAADGDSGGELAAAREWTDEQFRAHVAEARAETALRNDDSTLVALTLDERPTDGAAPPT